MGKTPGPKFKKGWVQRAPGTKRRTQTQKQDGVDGPKLKNKMASMGQTQKQDDVVCRDIIKEVVCWVSLSVSRYFVRV